MRFLMPFIWHKEIILPWMLFIFHLWNVLRHYLILLDVLPSELFLSFLVYFLYLRPYHRNLFLLFILFHFFLLFLYFLFLFLFAFFFFLFLFWFRLRFRTIFAFFTFLLIFLAFHCFFVVNFVLFVQRFYDLSDLFENCNQNLQTSRTKNDENRNH